MVARIDSAVGALDMICSVSAAADGAMAVMELPKASASGPLLVTLLRISSALTPLVTVPGRLIVRGAKVPLAPPRLVAVAERFLAWPPPPSLVLSEDHGRADSSHSQSTKDAASLN